MADNQWGEIFNLTAELKRIEDEVDKRLEETLAEDPHVIEQETVHYGAAQAAADRAEEFRMRQSVPLFGSVAAAPVAAPDAQNMTPDTSQPPAPDVADAAGSQYAAAASVDPTADAQRAEAASLEAAAAVWAEPPVDDYAAPRAAEPGESIYDPRPVEPEVPCHHSDALASHEGAPPVVVGEIENCEEPAEDCSKAVLSDVETQQEPDVQPQQMPEEAQDQAASEAVPAEAETIHVQEPAGEPAGSVQPVEAAGQAETRVHKGMPDWQQALRSMTADRRKVLGVLIAIIVVLAIILGGRSYKEHARLERQYQQGETLYENGDYDAAAEAFAAVSDYKDAAEQVLAAQYAKASAYVDAGSYQDAIDYVNNLSAPTDAMLTLRAHAIYQLAIRYYESGDMDAAEGELLMIKDYEEDGTKAIDLLHQIQYQSAADALAVYDYETAEPILAALGDYEDAPILLSQVQNAIDEVYTDVARDDNGKEIKGKTEYLWVHSVITPGAIPADLSGEEQTTALRELAGATGSVDDGAVHVLMMQMGTTDAAMTYEDAEPIETDSSTIITKDISSYAAIDSTFGKEQTVFSPQTLQRSNTDYALAFEGSETYAGKDRADDEVVMECKMADDGYWVKTRRVYGEMEDDRLIGVSKHQLRTWTKVLNESLADEVREAFLTNSK